MPDADPAASALDGIRENFAMRSKHAQGLGANPADFRCLLAALEAALKLADGWDAEFDRLDDLADKPGTDEEARPVLSGEAQGYSDCAAGLREAIGAALAEKETGDGG